jgi:hypothetical protein
MFETYTLELAKQHIDDLRREAATARLARRAHEGETGGSQRVGWLRRRRGHNLAAA